MAKIKELKVPGNRGSFYWLRPANLWASRRKVFRRDRSNLWRYANELAAESETHRRVRTIEEVLGTGNPSMRWRAVILGDTGEGDFSQYALVPLLRGLAPDLLILNGDIAYPAGNTSDFEAGFFAPYRGLGIPIWATPGNHEYYSRGKAREFTEIFASTAWRDRWRDAGLKLSPQPGTYWALTCDAARLCLVGLDSGQKGDLDGNDSDNPRDETQLGWLEQVLADADRTGRRAVVLFHIPAMVGGKRAKSVHLKQLHNLLAAHSSVRLVVTGHIHNLQAYSPPVWSKFLSDSGTSNRPQGSDCWYVVCGGGGAYLTSPAVSDSAPYQCAWAVPTAEEWREHISWSRRALARLGLGKSLVGTVVGRVSEANGADADGGMFGSCLVLDVDGVAGTAKVTPAVVRSIEEIAENRTTSGDLALEDPSFSLDTAECDACLKHERAIALA